MGRGEKGCGPRNLAMGGKNDGCRFGLTGGWVAGKGCR